MVSGLRGWGSVAGRCLPETLATLDAPALEATELSVGTASTRAVCAALPGRTATLGAIAGGATAVSVALGSRCAVLEFGVGSPEAERSLRAKTATPAMAPRPSTAASAMRGAREDFGRGSEGGSAVFANP